MNLKQKIQIIFFADTHLGFDFPTKPKLKRRRRGQDFFDNFQRILTFAIDKQVDLVVHGGDLFFRSKIPQQIVDQVYSVLLKFLENAIPFVIIPGNHERSRLPQSLLMAHPNFYIFDRPKTYDFNISNARIAISGFPCERNDIQHRFCSLLSETNWNKNSADIRLLLIHQTIEGAQVGPSNYTFRSGKDVIRLRDIPAEFNAVLAGHIHRKQMLYKQSMPIIYPGSIDRTSFAEKSEEKGFFKIAFENTNNNKWEIQSLNFVKLPTRPMVDILLTSSVNKENLKSFLLSKISNIDPNSIVRLKSNGRINDQIKQLLTCDLLRQVFPNTMNFQLSTEFYRSEKI